MYVIMVYKVEIRYVSKVSVQHYGTSLHHQHLELNNPVKNHLPNSTF